MTRKTLCGLLSALTLTTVGYAQQSNYSAVKISPETPRQGQTIEITYQPSEKPFQLAKSLEGACYYFNSKKELIAKTFPVKKVGKEWKGTYALDSDAQAFLLTFIDGTEKDMNTAKGYSFLIFGPNDAPLPGSYNVLAGLYQQQGRRIGVNTDEKKAAYYNEKFYAAADTSAFGLSEKLDFYAYKKDTAAALNLLTQIPLKGKLESVEYGKAHVVARAYKQPYLAEIIRNMQGTTRSQDAQKVVLFNDLIRAKGVEGKQAVVAKIKKEIPDFGSKASDTEYVNEVLSRDYTSIGNYDKALELIKNNTGVRGGYSHYVVASTIDYKNDNANIDKAIKAIERALAVQEEEKTTMKEKLAYQLPLDYQATLKRGEADYNGVYASLLNKKGDYAKAYTHQKKAIELGGTDNPKSNELYTSLMEKVKAPGLQKELENFIRKGQHTEAMKNQLKAIYTKKKSAAAFDAYFAGLEKEVREERLAKVKKELINEKAPDFTLRDVNGNSVSLASLKGKTVIVDFWATWCGPCIGSFPAMYKAQEKMKAEGKDVAFLFLNTWEREVKDKKQNVLDFMKDKPYKFNNVLLDEESKVVADYKVTGIPTKFIIDPKGQIRFKAVGFGGNDEETVQELEMMIKLANEG